MKGTVKLLIPNDPNPQYFHVKWNEYEAKISIKDISISEGELPSCIINNIKEWASKHNFYKENSWKIEIQFKLFILEDEM
jgi:hypothetical protein